MKLTETALRSLDRLVQATDIRDPVLTLARGTIPTGELVWGIAVYEYGNLAVGTSLVDVSGYKFYIDPSVEPDVANATLDFLEGKFTLLRD